MDYHSLDDADKKRIATRSSAKYATNPKEAVLDYMRCTGMVNLVDEDNENKSFLSKQKEAESEMLTLLPGYRHPTNDPLVEGEYFLGENLKVRLSMYQTPEWMLELKKIPAIPRSLLHQIDQYISEAEKTKFELGIEKNKYSQAQNRLDGAHDAYQPVIDGERPDLRANRVVKSLGLSTGKRKKPYDPDNLYESYVSYVRHKGLSRKNATLKVAEDYDLSENTVLNSLHKTCAKIKKEWKEDSPQLYEKHVKYRLNGLIMPKGDRNL